MHIVCQLEQIPINSFQREMHSSFGSSSELSSRPAPSDSTRRTPYLPSSGQRPPKVNCRSRSRQSSSNWTRSASVHERSATADRRQRWACGASVRKSGSIAFSSETALVWKFGNNGYWLNRFHSVGKQSNSFLLKIQESFDQHRVPKANLRVLGHDKMKLIWVRYSKIKPHTCSTQIIEIIKGGPFLLPITSRFTWQHQV